MVWSALLALMLPLGAAEQPAPSGSAQPEVPTFEQDRSCSFLDRLDATGSDDAEQGVVLTAIDPNGLAAVAGVQVGDRILGINGWAVGDGFDLMLLRAWLPQDRDQETTTLLRDAKRLTIVIPVTLPLRGGFSWSILSRCPQAAMDQLCSLVGLTPSSRDRQLLQWLPTRIWRSVLALGHRDPTSVPALKLLLQTYLDLTEDRDPPAAALHVATSDPFLTRIAGFWNRAATLGISDPTPDHLGEDAWFIADFYPHPTVPPAELGTVQLTDSDLQHVLERRSGGDLAATQDDQDDVMRRFGMVQDLPRDERSYLAQVAAAIIDSERQGGWPFRSQLVADATLRSAVIAGLQKNIAAGGPDAIMSQLALVGALANDNRWDEAADLAIAIGKVSPFLGDRAVSYVRGLPEIWHDTKLIKHLEDRVSGTAAEPKPRHAGLYAWCRGRNTALDSRAQAKGYRADVAPAIYIRGMVDVERALEDEAPTRNLALNQLWTMTSDLNDVAWDVSRFSEPHDAHAALLLAHQMRYWMTFMPYVHPYSENTIAVCYSVNSQFPLAAFWSRAAANDMAPGSNGGRRFKDIPDEVRAATLQRAELYAKGSTWSDVSPGVLVPTTVSEGGTATGGLCAGQRMGAWTISHPDGGKEAGWYVNGERTGLWTTYRADGTRVSEGFLKKGSQVGLWTTWTADGRRQSETWYNGSSTTDANHTGPWTEFFSNGGLKSQGWYVLGKKEGLWRTWHDNGQLESAGCFSQDAETGAWSSFDRDGRATVHHRVPQKPNKSDF